MIVFKEKQYSSRSIDYEKSDCLGNVFIMEIIKIVELSPRDSHSSKTEFSDNFNHWINSAVTKLDSKNKIPLLWMSWFDSSPVKLDKKYIGRNYSDILNLEKEAIVKSGKYTNYLSKKGWIYNYIQLSELFYSIGIKLNGGSTKINYGYKSINPRITENIIRDSIIEFYQKYGY